MMEYRTAVLYFFTCGYHRNIEKQLHDKNNKYFDTSTVTLSLNVVSKTVYNINII